MSKTMIIAAALATIVGLSASLPAQAATRSVGITLDRFTDRCIDQGGTLLDGDARVTCQTPVTTIDCGFVDLNNATCNWAGIENQIAVNRIIGMPDAQALNLGGEGDGSPVPGKVGGGGFKNNLPIKWK